jgi:non-ribosomal peptide synthetase component F
MTDYYISGDSIIRASDRKVLTRDPLNAEFKEFLLWTLAGGVPKPPPPEPAAALTQALQAYMDARAGGYGYDDLKAVCGYLPDDPNPRFAAEGTAFRAWRSNVWTAAYEHLALVQAGEAPFPTIDEAIAMMPALVITY